MPAVITTRSTVDISRVTRLFDTQRGHPAVTDKTLTGRQIKVLPVRISGQVKPLIHSASRCYPPPLVCRGYVHVGEGVSALCPAKGAFRRPKGSGTHFVRRNAVIPDILPCIVAGIFANLGHDIMARMGRYGRRTQSTGINRGCRSRPTQVECGQRRLPSAESDGKCRACLALPEVPASDLPALIHSRRNATCPVWPSAASAYARCEPFSANRLTPASRNSGT